MLEWELRDPWFLLIGVLAPLVYLLAARFPATVTFSSLSFVEPARPTLKARLARLPALLLALSTLILAVALAGPRTGDSTTRVRREGIAIMMVVDRSGSMAALDFQPDESKTRLDGVKEVFEEFVVGGTAGKGRPDDLIGLVVFARYADGICPLTLDHVNLLKILEQVEHAPLQGEESATAIGEGLSLAVERLRTHEAKSKVAILLTDGSNNAGEIEPHLAAELAAEHDIKVYCIGVGQQGPSRVRVKDEATGTSYLAQVRFDMDEKTLMQIAERTGGRYFHASNRERLREVYGEIDRLERSEITEVRYMQYTERYPALVLAALALIGISALASGTVLRRLP